MMLANEIEAKGQEQAGTGHAREMRKERGETDFGKSRITTSLDQDSEKSICICEIRTPAFTNSSTSS